MGKPWGILDSGLDAAARAAPAAPSALELPSHFQYFQAKSTVRKILEPHEFRSTISEQRNEPVRKTLPPGNTNETACAMGGGVRRDIPHIRGTRFNRVVKGSVND